jgi:hypothetical protein
MEREQKTSVDGSIREGSRVLIHDLHSMPEAEHNGRHGKIIGALHSISAGCWPVQVEGHCASILALRPENVSPAKLQRKSEPIHFSHLVRDGKITLLGFGSLVSKSSASRSFAFENFRLGTIIGYQRIFNASSWINYGWRYARVETGETCAVALMRASPSVASRIALMDVDAGEGLSGFLHRETSYDIFEVRLTRNWLLLWHVLNFGFDELSRVLQLFTSFIFRCRLSMTTEIAASRLLAESVRMKTQKYFGARTIGTINGALGRISTSPPHQHQCR